MHEFRSSSTVIPSINIPLIKRGRPQLRWEDCMRRDMRRSGEDERWREGAADRKLWKERTERVARQYFT